MISDSDIQCLIVFGLIAIISVTAFMEIAIPVQVMEYTQDFYDQIEATPEGSYVFVSVALLVYDYTEMNGAWNALINHLLENKLKIFIVAWNAPNEGYVDAILTKALGGEPKDDPRYGTEIVFLGVVLGGEDLGVPSLIEDIRSVKNVDFYGISLDDYSRLPMMEGFVGLKQCKLDIAGVDRVPAHLLSFGAYDIPVIVGIHGSGSVAHALTWWRAGQTKGNLNGLHAGAEYEAMTGYVGLSSSQILTQVSITSYVVIGMILTAVLYYIRKTPEIGGM